MKKNILFKWNDEKFYPIIQLINKKQPTQNIKQKGHQ